MIRRLLPVPLLLALVAGAARAHDGPPYPILVDEPLQGALFSIWADPDVGVGTFYLYLEAQEAGYQLPGIQLAAKPLDQEREELTYDAVLPDEEAPYQLVGEVDFDHRGPWQVRFVVTQAGEPKEFVLPVDVTPPGLGAFDIAWYLSPFLAIGLLWIKAMVSRHRLRRRVAPGPHAAPLADAPPGGSGPRSPSAVADPSSDPARTEALATTPAPRCEP